MKQRAVIVDVLECHAHHFAHGFHSRIEWYLKYHYRHAGVVCEYVAPTKINALRTVIRAHRRYIQNEVELVLLRPLSHGNQVPAAA